MASAGLSLLAVLTNATAGMASERLSSVASPTYACQDGTEFAVEYLTLDGMGLALVRFPDGQGGTTTRLLPQVLSGSGIRYAADGVELQSKGQSAFLSAQEGLGIAEFVTAECAERPS